MKNQVVRVRLTDIEKEIMLFKAKEFNMSISDYIKLCCLIVDSEKLKEIIKI